MPMPLTTETFVYTDASSRTVTIEIESYNNEITAADIKSKLGYWKDIPLFKDSFNQITAESGSTSTKITIEDPSRN